MDDFVRNLAKQVPVVLVARNHQFFTHELNDTRAELATRAASIPDVYFLDNQAVEIDGVTFLGSTLWSNFDRAHAALMKKSTSMMADYAVIADRTDQRKRLRPERILKEHQHSIAFLERELRARDPSRTVVVTRHAPSLRSTRSKGEDWEHLYGSDCDALIEDCGPALWIHGHVHESFNYRIGSTTVACNPRGYVRYGENSRFDPACSFTLQLA